MDEHFFVESQVCIWTLQGFWLPEDAIFTKISTYGQTVASRVVVRDNAREYRSYSTAHQIMWSPLSKTTWTVFLIPSTFFICTNICCIMRYSSQRVTSDFIRSLLIWDITRRRVVILYRRCGTTYRSHLQRSRSKEEKLFFLESLILQDGTDTLSRNVGKGSPLDAPWYSQPKPEVMAQDFMSELLVSVNLPGKTSCTSVAGEHTDWLSLTVALNDACLLTYIVTLRFVTACSLAGAYQRYGRTCCPHLHG
jgi:hypothetical protein